jgi:hypothetical protein
MGGIRNILWWGPDVLLLQECLRKCPYIKVDLWLYSLPFKVIPNIKTVGKSHKPPKTVFQPAQWLTPVIQATLKTVIMMMGGQPQHKFHETPILINTSWTQTSQLANRRTAVEACPSKTQDPIWKLTKTKRARGMPQIRACTRPQVQTPVPQIKSIFGKKFAKYDNCLIVLIQNEFLGRD